MGGLPDESTCSTKPQRAVRSPLPLTHWPIFELRRACTEGREENKKRNRTQALTVAQRSRRRQAGSLTNGFDASSNLHPPSGSTTHVCLSFFAPCVRFHSGFYFLFYRLHRCRPYHLLHHLYQHPPPSLNPFRLGVAAINGHRTKLMWTLVTLTVAHYSSRTIRLPNLNIYSLKAPRPACSQ